MSEINEKYSLEIKLIRLILADMPAAAPGDSYTKFQHDILSESRVR